MFWEKRLGSWVEEMRRRAALPLRLVLWNGRQLDLGMAAPKVTIRIPDASSLPYLLTPSLANLGKAYVEGKIEVEGRAHEVIRIGIALAANALRPEGRLGRIARFGFHTKRIDAEAIRYHYDVSNDFYRAWLDPDMVYSCAYFENGDEDLATAQRKKIDHILTKLRVRPGDRLLDIGCGWGALVLRAAEKFGARCVGITLSQNQYALAKERVQRAGLADRIDIRIEDYRDVSGKFDRITSVGMFEHVGLKNLTLYFRRISALLADDGVAMNHGITSTDAGSGATAYGAGDFIDEYVFPHGELPHISLVLRTMQEGGLEAIDIESLRRHYAKTCGMWADNFELHSDRIRSLVDDKRFRIWRVYLAGSAYAFEQDWISLYQVVCVKAGCSPAAIPWSRRYMYDAP
ncbi:MAG TPA: cyclopropane-fatty-acyl-phospholipid synthase family protein [Paucimonas sp.]|nr:cyclopropane-fatty-acyl-phospholipid synthase family protein [Paucimonas sp.]